MNGVRSRCQRRGGETLLGDKSYAGRDFARLAAAITLNHQLGRPSCALVNYCATGSQ